MRFAEMPRFTSTSARWASGARVWSSTRERAPQAHGVLVQAEVGEELGDRILELGVNLTLRRGCWRRLLELFRRERSSCSAVVSRALAPSGLRTRLTSKRPKTNFWMAVAFAASIRASLACQSEIAGAGDQGEQRQRCGADDDAMPPDELRQAVADAVGPGQHRTPVEMALEIVGECGGTAVAPLGLAGERLEHDRVQVADELAGVAARGRDATRAHQRLALDLFGESGGDRSSRRCGSRPASSS